MARSIVITDDITGEPGAAEREFGFAGHTYLIDLTENGYAEMETEFRRWIDRARKLPGKATFHAKPTAYGAEANLDYGKHSAEERDALWAWMHKNGVVLKRADGGEHTGKGRMPIDVWQAFRADDPTLLKPGRVPAAHHQQRTTTVARRKTATTQLPMDEAAKAS